MYSEPFVVCMLGQVHENKFQSWLGADLSFIDALIDFTFPFLTTGGACRWLRNKVEGHPLYEIRQINILSPR